MDINQNAISLTNIQQFMEAKGLKINEHESRTISSVFKESDTQDASGRSGADGFLNNNEWNTFINKFNETPLNIGKKSLKALNNFKEKIDNDDIATLTKNGVNPELAIKLKDNGYDPHYTGRSQVKNQGGEYTGEVYNVEFNGANLSVTDSSGKTISVNLNEYIKINANVTQEEKDSMKAKIMATLQKLPGEVLHDMISEVKGITMSPADNASNGGSFSTDKDIINLNYGDNNIDPRIITHEIGHAVHADNTGRFETAGETTDNKFQQEYLNNIDNIKGYAQISYYEAFAETYTEYMLDIGQTESTKTDLRHIVKQEENGNYTANYKKEFNNILNTNRSAETRQFDADAFQARNRAEIEAKQAEKEAVAFRHGLHDALSKQNEIFVFRSSDGSKITSDIASIEMYTDDKLLITDCNGKKYVADYDGEKVTFKKTKDDSWETYAINTSQNGFEHMTLKTLEEYEASQRQKQSGS